MILSGFTRIVLIIAFCTIPLLGTAKEVTLRYKQLTLNADLRLAPDKSIKDDVILLTHGGLAHRDMESLVYLRKLLYERGYNTLAINLSLGIDNRHGMYDCAQTHTHSNDDAVAEINQWLAWLQRQGANKIILAGHSRGGAQTALYATEYHSHAIKAVVLLAPATKENNDSAGYAQRYRQQLAPLQIKARQLTEQGKKDALLTHVGLMTCPDTSATAQAFLSYYGDSQRLDTAYLISKFKIPTLIVVAGDDAVVTNLEQKIAPLIDGRMLQMKLVAGADHLFRDLYADDAVEAIDAFLQSL